MDPLVVYASRCIQNGSDRLGLEALEDFNVGNLRLSPITEYHESRAFGYCLV
jgi:hypothetical protein